VARVIVVGAGIVGAAVAFRLAQAGADVLLVDRSRPASGVTGSSFAWIGGPRRGDAPDAGTPLRRRVLAEYRRLQRDVPGLRVHWRGAVLWDRPLPDDDALGPDERLLAAGEVRELEPHLRDRPARAVHLAGDGALDPVAATHALVRAAQAHGARLATGLSVLGVRVRDARVVGVEASTGVLPAETVVVAAGVDSATLCAPLGLHLPVDASPALLMRFAAPSGLVRTLVATADLEVREAADGELVVAAGYDGEGGGEDLRRAGERIRRHLVATFDAPDVRLLGVRLGVRPVPADGLPVVGPVPGVHGAYVAVMHSGVTLAPAVAGLVASEIVDGVPAPELSGLRPARFTSPVGR
jgi:glycine/D-amino acid oxidase-like deaminating enzyme